MGVKLVLGSSSPYFPHLILVNSVLGACGLGEEWTSEHTLSSPCINEPRESQKRCYDCMLGRRVGLQRTRGLTKEGCADGFRTVSKKRLSWGKRTDFLSEVVSTASLLYQGFIFHTSFPSEHVQSRFCLFSTKSEGNYNSLGAFPGAGGGSGCGIASLCLLGFTSATQEQHWGGGRTQATPEGSRQSTTESPGVCLLSDDWREWSGARCCRPQIPEQLENSTLSSVGRAMWGFVTLGGLLH